MRFIALVIFTFIATSALAQITPPRPAMTPEMQEAQRFLDAQQSRIEAERRKAAEDRASAATVLERIQALEETAQARARAAEAAPAAVVPVAAAATPAVQPAQAVSVVARSWLDDLQPILVSIASVLIPGLLAWGVARLRAAAEPSAEQRQAAKLQADHAAMSSLADAAGRLGPDLIEALGRMPLSRASTTDRAVLDVGAELLRRKPDAAAQVGADETKAGRLVLDVLKQTQAAAAMRPVIVAGDTAAPASSDLLDQEATHFDALFRETQAVVSAPVSTVIAVARSVMANGGHPEIKDALDRLEAAKARFDASQNGSVARTAGLDLMVALDFISKLTPIAAVLVPPPWGAIVAGAVSALSAFVTGRSAASPVAGADAAADPVATALGRLVPRTAWEPPKPLAAA